MLQVDPSRNSPRDFGRGEPRVGPEQRDGRERRQLTCSLRSEGSGALILTER